MTKDELVRALKEAVGGTPYGDAIVEEAAADFGDADKKYGQDMKDRLDEKLGVLKLMPASTKIPGKRRRPQPRTRKSPSSKKPLQL